MPVRFTILATLALTLCATSASAQPSLSRPTAKPRCGIGARKPCERLAYPNDVPWTFLVAVGGGFPQGLHSEAGVRVGNGYFYGGAGWFLPEKLERPPLYRFGVDGIFGKHGRGFAGGGMAFVPADHPRGTEVTALLGRIGVNTPLSKHLSMRLSSGLGIMFLSADCAGDEWCDPDVPPFPFFPMLEVNLALAYRR